LTLSNDPEFARFRFELESFLVLVADPNGTWVGAAHKLFKFFLRFEKAKIGIDAGRTP
jgi:hypothetical protein